MFQNLLECLRTVNPQKENTVDKYCQSQAIAII
ncbi:hypothetical protein NQ317_015886 [Molorchus minor]|uniref:Uncharacterized protein n=1 Tax=Molorchus minor TaxID=1323400 RepID=A0ABQ9IQ25_9CUCU|nr:hypothetical protein NQ317_015886 [Molorchus minor]